MYRLLPVYKFNDSPMTQPALTPKSLEEFLCIKEKKLQSIRRKILYNVFLCYVNTPDNSPINTTGLGYNLLTEFKGNELTFAFYIFGAIEQETLKGENFSLLSKLKRLSMKLYNKTDITLTQFENACQRLKFIYNKKKR
jgi:hypothetical protein